MKQEIKVFDDQFVATLSEKLSFTDLAAFNRTLSEMLASGKKRFVLDLSGLVSVDSAGLGMILLASEEATKGDWSLVLRSPQGQVKSMLDLTKFGHIVAIEG